MNAIRFCIFRAWRETYPTIPAFIALKYARAARYPK